jgi:hypothetical protein
LRLRHVHRPARLAAERHVPDVLDDADDFDTIRGDCRIGALTPEAADIDPLSDRALAREDLRAKAALTIATAGPPAESVFSNDRPVSNAMASVLK